MKKYFLFTLFFIGSIGAVLCNTNTSDVTKLANFTSLSLNLESQDWIVVKDCGDKPEVIDDGCAGSLVTLTEDCDNLGTYTTQTSGCAHCDCSH